MSGRTCGREQRRGLLGWAKLALGGMVAAVMLACLPVVPAAASTFVSAPLRADLAYDDARDILYISNGSGVLRYRPGTRSFLSPIETGGSLKGMDLSPDRETLAVADESFSDTEIWIHIVDLLTGGIRTITIPRERDESGTFAVAFGADRTILVSSSCYGSGNVPLRRVSLDSGAVTTIATVRQDTMLSASGDRLVIGFAEGNTADGSFGRYRVADGDILRKQGFAEGAGGLTVGIAVNSDGSQYAIPASWGTFIADRDLLYATTVGEYAGPRPIGAAYHPTRPIAFFSWAPTSEVRAYDMTSFTEVGDFDVQVPFPDAFGVPLTTGRLKVAGNGRYLFAAVDGGVSFFELPADLGNSPPEVDFLTVTTREDEPVPVNVVARDADGDLLMFTMTDAPRHGKLSGAFPKLLYTPNADYAGTDNFSFIVNDGMASSLPATVSVVVTPVNDPPSFTVSSSDVTARQGASLQIIPGFVSRISAGPPNESGESVKFSTKVTSSDLFAVVPAVNPDGALVFQPARGKKGSATVTITAVDNGGVANGGSDRSQPKTVTITIAK